jgi:arabinan endo-1,5-alpha-L-arabinosidase
MSDFISRRDFLRASAALGAGLTLPQLVTAQETTPEAPPTTPFEVNGIIRPVHDPAIIRGEDAYYLFCTGMGIPVLRSTNLVDWRTASPPLVFAQLPEWAQAAIPGQADAWAPDISYFNGKYHLYYSVSTFGSNRSVIGLATNVTLNVESPDFRWVDEGLVIESQRSDNYNCIDANLIIDADGNPWLAFGSFWSGIKLRRLDYATGKLSTEDETLYPLAQRFVNSGSVEAPFIIRKGDFYYLFVSHDFCCRGVESTYHVVVGRSENITGPYVDRDGVALTAGGGTQVTFPSERWKGPGHNSILQENGVEYIVYHAYDARLCGSIRWSGMMRAGLRLRGRGNAACCGAM